MADVIKDMPTLKSGPAGSIKADSVNAAVATKQADAKANAEAKKVTVSAGSVQYKTMGQNDFSASGIKFGASLYTTSDKEEQAILDGCVARKLLKVVEDKRG